MQPQYIILPHNAIDITGQRFGRLIALGPVGRSATSKIVWQCRCDCGNILNVVSNSLRTGNTQSCGCLQRERTSNARKTHGMTESHDYGIWCGILKRCTNPHFKDYANYGGRGITVCDEWLHDFESFYDHVSALPHYGEPGYSIDRIDNEGNYEPGNVRWASQTQQSRNMRRNVMLTHNGKTQSVVAWADELHMHRDALYGRLRRGWSIERSLTTPC